MTATLLVRKWNGQVHHQIFFGDTLPATIRQEIKNRRTTETKITDAEAQMEPRAVLPSRERVPGHASNAIQRATLDEHCDHKDNLNADKTRCLSCGFWVRT